MIIQNPLSCRHHQCVHSITSLRLAEIIALHDSERSFYLLALLYHISGFTNNARYDDKAPDFLIFLQRLWTHKTGVSQM